MTDLSDLFDEKFSEFLLPVMSDFIKRNEKRATLQRVTSIE